jgi:RNA-directed DNA polymerase
VRCQTREEAQRARAVAERCLREELGVERHPQKTRMVPISQGFEFLGSKVKQGTGHRLPAHKRRGWANPHHLYAIPREKSVQRFKDQIRALTRRKAPLTRREVSERINPVMRGWGHCYRKADVRRLFHRLDGWIERRLYSFLAKRWRNPLWRRYPTRRLIGEFGLVRLTHRIPGLVRWWLQGGAAKESGLRENGTSRLSERTEAGRPSPTSSDSTAVGVTPHQGCG